MRIQTSRPSVVTCTLGKQVTRGGTLPSTALAVARIAHAVQSPRYPTREWSSHRLWGRYADVDIVDLRKVASVALANARALGRDTHE